MAYERYKSLIRGGQYYDPQYNPVDEQTYQDWRAWKASQSTDSPKYDPRFQEGENYLSMTPQQKLYLDVAEGRVQLSPDQFDTLLSNEDLGMSQFEFSQLPPEIQRQARANPQLFMQSVLSNTSNKDHGDLLSLGAEGGYSDYQTAQWGAGGLTPDQSKYMQIQEEPNWGLYVMLAAMGGLAAAGMGAFGAAAQSAVTGIEASAAALGVAPEALTSMAVAEGAGGAGAFVPSAATGGAMGTGMTGINATLGLGATPSMLAPELALLGGEAAAITPASLGIAGATGGGIMTAAGGAAYTSALAAGLTTEQALAAAVAAGGTVGTGGAGLTLSQILSGAKTAAGALGATGAGGGVGGAGGGGSSTSESAPWAPQQPYLLDIMENAKKNFDAGGPKYFPGSTVAGRSDETVAAEEELLRYANGDARDMTDSLARATKFGLEGVLDPNSNEYLAAAVEGALRPVTTKYRTEVMPAISSEAQKQGAYGGSRHGIADSLASELYLQSLGDISSKMYSDAYGKGLDTMTRTMALTPENIKAGTLPASLIANVGGQRDSYNQTLIDAAKDRWDYEQNAPMQNLNNYRQMVTGQYGGTTTKNEAPVKTNKFLTALGGGLTGAGLGNSIAGLTDGAVSGNVGTGIGATLGLILGSL